MAERRVRPTARAVEQAANAALYALWTRVRDCPTPGTRRIDVATVLAFGFAIDTAVYAVRDVSAFRPARDVA